MGYKLCKLMDVDSMNQRDAPGAGRCWWPLLMIPAVLKLFNTCMFGQPLGRRSSHNKMEAVIIIELSFLNILFCLRQRTNDCFGLYCFALYYVTVSLRYTNPSI